MDRGHFESIEKPCLGIGDFRKAPDEKATDPQTSLFTERFIYTKIK